MCVYKYTYIYVFWPSWKHDVASQGNSINNNIKNTFWFSHHHKRAPWDHLRKKSPKPFQKTWLFSNQFLQLLWNSCDIDLIGISSGWPEIKSASEIWGLCIHTVKDSLRSCRIYSKSSVWTLDVIGGRSHGGEFLLRLNSRMEAPGAFPPSQRLLRAAGFPLGRRWILHPLAAPQTPGRGARTDSCRFTPSTNNYAAHRLTSGKMKRSERDAGNPGKRHGEISYCKIILTSNLSSI